MESAIPVIGPGEHSSSFSEKLPPGFDGHMNYAVYSQQVKSWLLLTSIEKWKRGPALIGRLSGEVHESAMSLT